MTVHAGATTHVEHLSRGWREKALHEEPGPDKFQ